MEPNDEQLKEQLAPEPLSRNGFDARLRQRIEKRIEEESRRRPWKTIWRLPAAAFACMAVVMLGIWFFSGKWGGGQPADTNAESVSTPLASMEIMASDAPLKKYGLLIGLRNDGTQNQIRTDSTYRTILVAPEAGQLQKVADNPGLYLPYKQDFWHIATISTSDGRQGLQAIQVTNRKGSKPDVAVIVPPNLLSERVEFAGNQYLSLDSTLRDGAGKLSQNWRVKRIDQINTKSVNPAKEPHVLLKEVIPNLDPSAAAADQWSIGRNPGQWVPVLHEADSGDGQQPLKYILPAQVVNQDKLSLSWKQIQQFEPLAQDAFTYGNLLGVVAGNVIRVMDIREGTTVRQVLNFPMAQGEKVIMIQWAEGHYVDRWIEDMRSLSRK
ncbi:MAG: hypothetical protein JWR03_1809 [Cohnella sp.]|nr:hypothetical protein [Cohnella sp.]